MVDVSISSICIHIWIQKERERERGRKIHTHTERNFYLNNIPNTNELAAGNRSQLRPSAAQYDAASDGHHHPDDLASSKAD